MPEVAGAETVGRSRCDTVSAVKDQNPAHEPERTRSSGMRNAIKIAGGIGIAVLVTRSIDDGPAASSRR